MRAREFLAVACVVGSGFSWIACGGDDAAVIDTDSGAADATTDDAVSGDDSGGGSDTGTRDAGAGTDSSVGCDAGSVPAAAPGTVYCPGSPTQACDLDASYCCGSQCKAKTALCGIGAGIAECVRPSDCSGGACCAHLDNLDLDASVCLAKGQLTTATCGNGSGKCTIGALHTCEQDTDCEDAGRCTAAAVEFLDGSTTIGVCTP